MPNLDFNAGFEPEEGSTGGENLSGLGFHPADENEEDLEEELEEDNEEEDDDEEDFDLADEEDPDASAPVLGGIASGPVIVSASDDEDDEDEDDEDGEELTEEIDEDDDEEDTDEAAAENPDDDCVVISKSKIILARRLLENIKKSTDGLISLFSGEMDDGDEDRISIGEITDGMVENDEEGGKVIEGVFDGENMIGPDGKEYSVPANYASKSKLVEGDMLKLTITDRGTFIYKQTKPVERKRLIGKLEKDVNGNYVVKAEHKKFRVITASITYYKGIPGDKVVLLIPVAGDSAWGAVDNVIKSK